MTATAQTPIQARLYAALDSLETTNELIGELRQGETFRAQRTELRSVADLVAEARSLVRVLLGEGRVS
jgi:hypothetical protein